MEQQEKKYKYICENCNFKCNAESTWDIHCNTQKHKTGKNKKRSDFAGPHKCNKCKYESPNKINMLRHELKYHSTKEEREKGYKYYCKVCDYGTFSEDCFKKHKLTTKHEKMINIMN